MSCRGGETSGALEVSEIYEKIHQIGRRVIVVGAGVSGCEAALFLAESGRDVVIVDKGAAAMPHYSRLPRIALMDKLMAQGVELRPGVQVIQLLPGG